MSDTEQTELFERRYSRVLAEALAHLNEEVQRRQAALDGAASKLSAIKGLRDRVQATIREAADREAANAPGPDALSDEEAKAASFCIGSGCAQFVAEEEDRGICGKVPGLNLVIPGQTSCPTVPDRIEDVTAELRDHDDEEPPADDVTEGLSDHDDPPDGPVESEPEDDEEPDGPGEPEDDEDEPEEEEEP